MQSSKSTASSLAHIEIRHSSVHGRGVFAARDLPPGTLIGVYANLAHQCPKRFSLFGHVVVAVVAEHHGTSLATRNVGDFEGCAVVVVNPWERTA